MKQIITNIICDSCGGTTSKENEFTHYWIKWQPLHRPSSVTIERDYCPGCIEAVRKALGF